VLLLKAGADTRLVDKDHNTARDLAKENGYRITGNAKESKQSGRFHSTYLSYSSAT
jgi:hypothetical protein